MGATRSLGVAFVAAGLLSAPARAQSSGAAPGVPAPPPRPAPVPPPAPAPDRVEHWVDFRADRVELEPDAGALELDGAVVVTSRRFRLTSEAVTLTRTGRGVHVEGKGNLALCACPKPPITLGFAAADLAPPTDVLLQHATLRVGPVPVFYWPYLWLRSPDRTGLLPPSFGYRGVEGLWLGSGLHVPLGTVDGGRRALDVGVAGYLRGGVRTDVALAGLGGRTALSFDWYRREALDLVSAHARADRSLLLAERIDVVRGRRGLEAPSDIERVTLPSDRLRIAVGHAERSVVALVLAGDAARGGGLGELGVVGPGLVVGGGRGLGRFAEYAMMAGLSTVRTPTGGVFAAHGALDFTSALPLGVVRSELAARQRAELIQLSSGSARELRSEFRARAGVPLARRGAALTHTIEPFAEAAVQSGLRSTDAASLQLPQSTAPRRAVVAALGLDNALGSNRGRGAMELTLSAGFVADRAQHAGVLGAESRLDAGPARLAAVARVLPVAAAAELSLRAEVSVAQNLGLGLRLDGSSGDVREAAGFFRSDFSRPAGALFDRSGWSARGRVRIPWGPGLFAELGSDVDISEKLWLASAAALGYRHGCRCLSLVAAASRRLGRRGVDVGLSIEIAPR